MGSPAEFSQRQREVLDLLREGLSNREMADRLGLAESTVSGHMTVVVRRLGVKNRAEAAAILNSSGEDVEPSREQSPDPRLTPRQAEVLGLVAEGLTNRQIARRLAISEKTVKAQLSTAYLRLGAGNRVQAAAILSRSHRAS